MPAAAEPIGHTPLHFKGVYEFSFIGLHFGRIGIEADQSPDKYNMAADVTSTGVANLFTSHASHTVVTGSGQSYNYSSKHYVTHYQTKKKKKSVELTYANGQLSKEIAVPADTNRSPVPHDLKEKAYDPLTFLLALRQSLYEALKDHKEQFTLYIYDGRRLNEVDFTVISTNGAIPWNKERLPVIQVMGRRRMIGGFTPSELAEANPKEPPLRIYFTNDERLLPVRMEFSYLFSTVSATLIKQCPETESCLFGLTD